MMNRLLTLMLATITLAMLTVTPALTQPPDVAEQQQEKPAAPYVTDFDAARSLAAERNQFILLDFWRPG